MWRRWAVRLVVLNQCLSAVTGAQTGYPTLTELCPTRDFCHSPATEIFQKESLESCCQSCSCVEDCHVDGNCCPDVHISDIDADDSPLVLCADLGALLHNGRLPKRFVRSSYKRVTSTCPASVQDVDVTDEVIQRCNTPVTLPDYNPVSNKAGNKLYRNKHCARCNAEIDVVPWNLFVYNCHQLVEEDVTSKEDMEALILESCEFYAQPISYLYDQNVRCFPESKTINSCNATGHWDVYDADIENACLTSAPRRNNNYRTPGTGPGTYVFNNIYCYFCNSRSSEITIQQVCKKFPISDVRGLPQVPFSVLIPWDDADRTKTIRADTDSSATCGKSGEIYDRFLDTCRQMVCSVAMVPSYGSCEPLGNSQGIGLTIILTIDGMDSTTWAPDSTSTTEPPSIWSTRRSEPDSASSTWTSADVDAAFDAFIAYSNNGGLLPKCKTRYCEVALVHDEALDTIYFQISLISLSVCPYHEMLQKVIDLWNQGAGFEFETTSGETRNLRLSLNMTLDYNHWNERERIAVKYQDPTCGRSPHLAPEMLETCPRLRMTVLDLNVTLSNETLSRLVDARIETEDPGDTDGSFTICVSKYEEIMSSDPQYNVASSLRGFNSFSFWPIWASYAVCLLICVHKRQ